MSEANENDQRTPLTESQFCFLFDLLKDSITPEAFDTSCTHGDRRIVNALIRKGVLKETAGLMQLTYSGVHSMVYHISRYYVNYIGDLHCILAGAMRLFDLGA